MCLSHDSYFKNLQTIKNGYDQPFWGEYCEKHKIAFVKNPGIIFYEMLVLFDIEHSHLIRKKALAGIGKDIQPNIGDHRGYTKNNQFLYQIRSNGNIF